MQPTEPAIRDYFRRMAEIRGTGGATGETSYYPALENLLNAIGKSLTPQVICNSQLKSQGAGHPDFGLYGKNQCAKGAPKPGQGEIPEHGVIEVKPLSDDAEQTAQGAQVSEYLGRYGLVLVTNYREFHLIGADANGNPTQLESFTLAPDESAFWEMAKTPQKSAKEQANHFGEFLQRVMKASAPLTKPEDVAWFLASYARDALATLEEKESTALAPLRKSLEAALGTTFEGDKGERFFRSTLVQTLFYGIFSAWVNTAKDGKTEKFDWRLASHIMTVPMIRSLFEEVAKPTRLEPLGLTNILDRTGQALNRIEKIAFFKAFNTDEAIRHFYEPFLAYFDPDLRKELGVWYTPPEIVKYMVERVDTVLREELGITDGLADEKVYVLDPCCGTGTYVVEVLRKIEETLRAKGDDGLIGQDVKKAAQKRVFGFEIMSAPFVIAHWQVGNLLERLGAPIDSAQKERPAIYLTNALTGWEPPTGPKEEFLFPELAQERDQAQMVKQKAPILVVLGNPPYNAYAGTSPKEEGGLIDPYKEGLREKWRIKKSNLGELYVRFLRIAERRIEETGKGIVCYISSYSYLSDPQFVVARDNLLKQFDRIWIDSLNGDSRETGKKTPDGKPDPSVFSTKYNKAGIRLGTAVGLFLKRPEPDEEPSVVYRDFWGKTKREDLLASLPSSPFNNKPFDDQYEVATPLDWNKLSFRPIKVSQNYLSWPTLRELTDLDPFNGLMEKRKGGLIDIDCNALAERMKNYFDTSIDWAAFKLTGHPLAIDASGYKAEKTRFNALKNEIAFTDNNVVRYIVRPFDVRYAYYTDTRTIWNSNRPNLWKQFYSKNNQFLATRSSGVAKPEGIPTFFTRCLGDNDAQKGHSYYFPFKKYESGEGMLSENSSANLSKKTRAWLKNLGFPDPDADEKKAAAPWHHALAITYAPRYLSENADGIAIDWPRVPLPDTAEALAASAALGQKIAALLDTDKDVEGVTDGNIAGHIKEIGNIAEDNLSMTAGWGSDKKGKVYPGIGKTEIRHWTDAEKTALRKGFADEGINEARGFALLGRAVDVYLNETNYWRGVPEEVWGYYIGGYQVIKKWLSYREEKVLGRALEPEEAREVTAMVRRLAAIILLGDALDANYTTCRDNAYGWPGD